MLSGLWHRRSGNVALVVALAIVPLCGIVGLAVDFGRLSWVKGKLDLAADSSALLAATTAANSFKAGDLNYINEGIAAARGRFAAQTGNQPSVVIGSINVGLTQTGGLFNATVTYTAQIGSTFANLIGLSGFTIGDQAGASLSYNPFVDVQILMDVSSSMTLAATASDQATMEQLTANYKPTGKLPSNVSKGEACAFACHWTTTGDDYYQLALRNNVQLRLTVLRSAVGQVIQTMQAQDQNSRFQIGLYTFSDVFNTIYALSSDVADASNALSSVVPALNDCSGQCDNTYFTNAMSRLTTIDMSLPQQGTNVPQKFLFLISDGVYDETVNGSRKINAFSASDCAALKALNVSILVLYTPYLQIPDNAFWVNNVEPIQGNIQPNLEACASSPSYFFIANDASDIQNQLNAMFALVLESTSHLIQ